MYIKIYIIHLIIFKESLIAALTLFRMSFNSADIFIGNIIDKIVIHLKYVLVMMVCYKCIL